MEGQRLGGFPLLVRGDWGSAEPPPALRRKLLRYFQSQKRSGGGECELRAGDGQLLVCFVHPEVRQRVLDRRVHELEWEPRGQLSLLVTELPADGCQEQEVAPAGGAEASGSCEELEVKKASPRKSVIVVTTASGEEIEDEIVEMYFENKKKSGGGTIKSYIKKDQQMVITFQNEEDAQEVLQRKRHSVKKIDLFVKPWQVDILQEPGQVKDFQRSLPSATVVIENVQETVKDCMLILLVENISGLSEDDGDFSVEMIPEIHAAVVTFTENAAAGEFVEKFNQNHRAKEQNITARSLELTKSIRAENIPPNIPSDYITIYFENKKNGGAHVEDVQQLPDEDAAIITFNDHKDVTNILAKKHTLNKTPIFVYPFYTSLGTALYGKEGPQMKKPDPIILPLDPYIWYYLLKNNRLIETISCEMAKHNCVLTWPEACCEDPKVTLHPSAALSEQKRSVSRVIKTWNENVSTAFSHSISKYKVIKCQVSAEVWEAIRNCFTHGEYLIIPYISKDLHVLVGEKEVVKNVEQELTLLIQKATRETEREIKRTEETVLTDIVVISVAKDLQLNKGALSRALLRKAGPMLQRGLKEEGLGKTPEEGSVLKTKGYNLSCSVVLHAVVPAWLQRYASAKVLGDIITKCLEIAEELSLKSITFPAIGTGNLGFPRSVVAKLLFDKVFEFSSKNGVNSLEEVHFLLHPEDIANIQEFSDELKSRCGNTVDVEVQKTSPSKTSQDTGFSGTSSMPAQNVHEMTIGSIVFQVAEGDITKEEGDVIVNITNKTFSLKIGVSRAILNGAGKAVEDECAQLASQANKSYITTQAGRLPCKKIIHFVAQDDIKMLVSTVLQECEFQQYTSVTFPAIGTGQAGHDAAAVAEDMLDAVTDFARSNSAPYVKTVKVVIFQPHLLSVFHTSMQKRENSAKTAAKLQVSKLKSSQSSENLSPHGKDKAVLKKKIELAVVQICGESKKKVEETEGWLRSAVLKEQFQVEITDEFISDFVEEQSGELRDLQNKLRIALYLDGPSIRISGLTKDVWIAYSTIQDMIYRVKNAKLKESSAELLKSVIEWKYYEKDSYVPFDNLTNMRLENAFLAKEKDISVIINEKKYTVNLEAKHVVDDQGKCTPIIRVDKCQESIVLPETWDDMENQRLKIVELRPETEEYRDVQKRFLETCQSFKIEKIERVQNLYLWKTYQIKKCEMDNKNGNKNNERQLFHGTSKNSLTLINNGGFNRSYAGMHAAHFGNGTYFAVKASYSANATYSTPDIDGKKYMYLARVLVGEYSRGTKGSIIPAAKNAGNSTDRFDSSADDVKQPSIFIIFHDTQAYPEYLITFTAQAF
ncbi:protein mono-ADP-ribosyltransferase PARP14 isoform X2 [Melopsittacus undulatus]|uniref:protein mono-ADP-ribosyltransferase PARP14 isoform X2 n=1 Tax=Melopsittacus undulatus TaxID=13146 RepID=UPI00146EA68B|nr:protein mono-ADP-ribosyltransferase PARP14 isoform X2 [Melopsittacus undulatus]